MRMRAKLMGAMGSTVALCFAVMGLGAESTTFTPRVTEVTVFKDGHALVLARGSAKLEDGWCRTQEVPVPVLGTFWSFVADNDAQVDVVRSAMIETKVDRPCMTLDEMIQANTGKTATVIEHLKDTAPASHTGKLLGILSYEAPQENVTIGTTPPGVDVYGRYLQPQPIPEAATVTARVDAGFVMLEIENSVKLIKREHITSISLGDRKPGTTHTDTRMVREIAMHVVSKGKPVNKQSEVGVVYLQKGIRWIPDYRIQLADDGKARLILQGTVINEMADLEKVNLHLVVGVPSFVMKDLLSPLALREVGLKLSSYFRPPAPGDRNRQDYNYMANSTMSQQAVVSFGGESPQPGGPDIPTEGQQEDLFLYDQPGFSLKKGECAIVQLLDVTVPYEDIYTWEIAPVPPMELWQNFGQEQQRQLAASLTGAKAMHVVRLTNTGAIPWTTAPAAVYKHGTIMGQQLLTYTSVKNKVDVPVTVATDVNTKKEDSEAGREENVQMNGQSHTKFLMRGELTVTNFKDKPVHVVITRKAIGTATRATEGGRIRMSNSMEDTSFAGNRYPWFYWNWRGDYSGVNSLSEISWEATIPAGKAQAFEYDWHYFLRR
jgi:hypothetical protein